MATVCAQTGETFEISERERKLAERFDCTLPPTLAPHARLRHLGAFWQHWNLHQRSCSKSGGKLISVFGDDCPYPVWHHQLWIEDASPPETEFSIGQPAFPQLWSLFQQCPIPHNVGAGNQNSEYTDDMWYSKNCYLCHSGYQSEDLKYCYRAVQLKDCQFCAMSFRSELCVDLVYCKDCFEVVHSLNCQSCQRSAFLYDCRHCTDCLFCTNLRHRQYCIENRQYSKDDYNRVKQQWTFSSRQVYDRARRKFASLLDSTAYHRAAQVDKCEASTGDYLENTKNCENVFFASEAEDCVNYARGHRLKDQLNCVGSLLCELSYWSVMAQDACYDVRFSYNVTQCRYVEYCGFCFQCQYCFGCCGLVGKSYCIMNRQYPPDEYFKKIAVIKNTMQATGEYGCFFPAQFAASCYNESWSKIPFPLTDAEQQALGFRVSPAKPRESTSTFTVDDVPDSPDLVPPDLAQRVFWDHAANRPVRITEEDVAFCRRLSIPLPNSFYINRLQANFDLLNFRGRLRDCLCGATGMKIATTLPARYEPRILCEEAYSTRTLG